MHEFLRLRECQEKNAIVRKTAPRKHFRHYNKITTTTKKETNQPTNKTFNKKQQQTNKQKLSNVNYLLVWLQLRYNCTVILQFVNRFAFLVHAWQ